MNVNETTWHSYITNDNIQNVALGLSVHDSDRADPDLFAGILQAKIR